MKHHYKAIYKDITARNQLHTVKFDRKEDSQSDFACLNLISHHQNSLLVHLIRKSLIKRI